MPLKRIFTTSVRMYTVFTSAYKMNLYDNCRIIFSIVKSRMVSGQFKASNSMHSSCDVCSSCMPMLSIDFYLLKAGK